MVVQQSRNALSINDHMIKAATYVAYIFCQSAQQPKDAINSGHMIHACFVSMKLHYIVLQ